MSASSHLRSLAVLAAAVAAIGSAPGFFEGAAQAASAEELQRLRENIRNTERRVDLREGRERVLTADVRRYGVRISGLQERIATLESRERVAQDDLAQSAKALEQTRGELRAQRRRLAELRARLTRAKRVLGARLVELYQADKPDLVGVVVSSRGFIDLLERAEFLARIGRQDQRVVGAVRTARTKAEALARHLAALEGAQRRAAARMKARRSEITRVKARVISTRSTLEEARASRASLLRSVRVRRQGLQDNLASMRREESRVRARLAATPPIPAVQAAGFQKVKRGTGSLTWPVDGQFTSPFGQRWGRLHAGIDIAVPTGTPVRAAGAGTVAVAGWTGGYGNYVCVNVGDGLSACGAHNSQLKVRVGQRVAEGEVIALSGNTGNSTGPHVHFETRVGGVPRDPMRYL